MRDQCGGGGLGADFRFGLSLLGKWGEDGEESEVDYGWWENALS